MRAVSSNPDKPDRLKAQGRKLKARIKWNNGRMGFKKRYKSIGRRNSAASAYLFSLDAKMTRINNQFNQLKTRIS